MSQKKSILVVDDTKANITILLSLLSDYDILVALNGEKALTMLEKNSVDLILLDIVMPNMDGYEVCSRIKANENTKDIPIIFLTSKIEENDIEKAYDVGGNDYLAKPFKPKELLARVKTQLKLRELITNLEYISYHDPLTGIYNRRRFFILAEEKFKNNNKNLYGVMLDIDKFKSVNDTYGHSIGDIVIKHAVNILKNSLDDRAILGRLGGEEFAIICDSLSKNLVFDMVERARKSIELSEIKLYDGTIIKFTISAGISKYSESIENIDSLLQDADVALYEAKQNGRNRTIVHF